MDAEGYFTSVVDAMFIFNPVGTGMWHEHQYEQWNSIARARASENGVFVLGCSHFNDTIPFAFAYTTNGECLVKSREVNRVVYVSLDFDKYQIKKNFSQRRPELYGDLTKTNGGAVHGERKSKVTF